MTSKKKQVVESEEKPEKVKFTKEQLISSKKYKGRKDLLNVILKDNETYDFDEVDDLIDEFMKVKG